MDLSKLEKLLAKLAYMLIKFVAWICLFIGFTGLLSGMPDVFFFQLTKFLFLKWLAEFCVKPLV